MPTEISVLKPAAAQQIVTDAEAARDASQTARTGSEAAETGAVTAQGIAETARDVAVAAAQTVGAFADATLAAAIAAGLAGTSEGETFTAKGDDVDYIGLYRHDSGTVAFEIGRLPKSSQVERLAQIGRDAEQMVPVRSVSTFVDSYPEFYDTGKRLGSGENMNAVLSAWNPIDHITTGTWNAWLFNPTTCFQDLGLTIPAGDGDQVAVVIDANSTGTLLNIAPTSGTFEDNLNVSVSNFGGKFIRFRTAGSVDDLTIDGNTITTDASGPRGFVFAASGIVSVVIEFSGNTSGLNLEIVNGGALATSTDESGALVAFNFDADDNQAPYFAITGGPGTFTIDSIKVVDIAGNHLSCKNTTLRQNWSGKWGLEFNGVDSEAVSAGFSSGHSTAEIVVAAHKLTEPVSASALAGGYLATQRGTGLSSWSLRVPSAVSFRDAFVTRRNTATEALGDDLTPPPHAGVWMGRADLQNALTELLLDGQRLAVSNAPHSVSSYGWTTPAPVVFGRMTNNTEFFEGIMYGAFYRQADQLLDDGHRIRVETYLRAQMGPLVHSIWQGVSE